MVTGTAPRAGCSVAVSIRDRLDGVRIWPQYMPQRAAQSSNLSRIAHHVDLARAPPRDALGAKMQLCLTTNLKVTMTEKTYILI